MLMRKTKKQKGGFLVDILLAMLILMLGIVPLISSISFAYHALTSSVEKTFDINEEVHDEIDEETLACSFGGGFPTGFDGTATNAITVTGNGFVAPTPPTLYYKSVESTGGNRTGEIKIYVVK